MQRATRHLTERLAPFLTAALLICFLGGRDTVPARAGSDGGTPISGGAVHSLATVSSQADATQPCDASSSGSWLVLPPAGAVWPRSNHTAVWTGSEMITWGGGLEGRLTGIGERYDPGTGAWTMLPIDGAPSPRQGHSAVWTGSEMIVWGAIEGTSRAFRNDGARFRTATNEWAPMSSDGAPSPRAFHAGIWTGEEMIIWGGYDASGAHRDGARYNPSTDVWRPMSTAGAPAGLENHAVWTGSEVIIWNGTANGGARYDPATDTWGALSGVDAPPVREAHRLVWTGEELIVWGGLQFGTATEPGAGFLDDGARYDPDTDSWQPLSSHGAPAARAYNSAIWTGNEMIVWGGGSIVDGNYVVLGDGARYDPTADAWEALPAEEAPSPQEGHIAVWTGSEMIISGGESSQVGSPTRVAVEGGRYCAVPDPIVSR